MAEESDEGQRKMPVEGDGGTKAVMAEEGDGGQRKRPLEGDGETEGVMAEEGDAGQRKRPLEGDGDTEKGKQQGEQYVLPDPDVGTGAEWRAIGPLDAGPGTPLEQDAEAGPPSKEDVTLQCSDGTLFYVNEKIISRSCAEFEAMFSSSMMEGRNRVVHMPSYASPPTVHCFREWMCRGELLILCPWQWSCCGRCVDSLYSPLLQVKSGRGGGPS